MVTKIEGRIMSDDNVEFDFSNEVQKGRWELLKPHYERETVFVVNEPLDLQTVAHCLAKDQVNILKIWLDNKDVYKLEKEHTSELVESPTKDLFDFIIVQPFIIIKF
jgi:hypothetical protein